MFTICFSQEKTHFFLMCTVATTEYRVFSLFWPVQAGPYPPAESISLFVIALLESVLLETKLHWVNGFFGASADIQVIMISFGVCLGVLYVFVISDFFSPNKCHLLRKHISIFRKVGLMFVPTVSVLYNVVANPLNGVSHLERKHSCAAQ